MKYEIRVKTQKEDSCLFEEERYKVSGIVFYIIRSICETQGKKI